MGELHSSDIGTERSAAIDRLLDHLRELEGDPDLGVDDVRERYGDALELVPNQDDVAEVIIGLHNLQMRYTTEPWRFQVKATPEQTAQFLLHSTPQEALRRLERLIEWVRGVNVQNHDGVLLTPALIDFLAEPGDFEERLGELDRLRAETRAGRFDVTNDLQRNLEYNRYASEMQFNYDLPRGSDEQLAAFHELEELPPPEYEPFSLTGRNLKEVKRVAYEAAGFLKFLRDLRAQTDRPVAVVGNDRYGRQWVVEPLEPWLKGDFIVRYFRNPSHKSYRLAVRHEIDVHRLGFTRDFVQEIDELSPHVVIADSCSPIGVGRRDEDMRMSRGSRDYVNWFMVFNDIRADGDGTLYEGDSSLPLEQFPEMRKWHEYVRVSRLIKPWVSPGPTYKVAHWGPVKKATVRLGDRDVPRCDPDPSDGRPMVIICNPAVYMEESELPEELIDTTPYYFDGPERHVVEEVKRGFGPYGLESRIIGATTGEFIEAVQQEMTKEIERLVGLPP